MKIINILLVVVFWSQIALCDTDPFFAKAGTPLPRDSWVFSQDKAKEVRDHLIDLATAQQANESYKTSLSLDKEQQDIQNNKVKLLLDQNDQLAKRLNEERSVNEWEKFGYFVLGIVGTGIGAWAIGQIRR